MENFKTDLIKEGLLRKLNELRLEKNLPALKYSDVLEKAADDQVIVNRKFNTVSSVQNSSKKSSPAQRVKYYQGLYAQVEEFDIGIDIQTKTVLKAGKKKSPSTYQDVIDYISAQWQNDRQTGDLLFNKNLFETGFGFAPNHIDGILFATIVLGSEPYVKNSSFRYNAKAFKIAPYDRNVCKEFERDFEYVAELFSDNIRYEGNKIFFYYHDLSLIESLFKTNKDGLALDIMFSDQYSCEKGNALHPSQVHNGMLLKPVFKNKLLKSNSLKEVGEFKSFLGLLPAGTDTNQILTNIIVIRDRCACKDIAYNDLNGKNIRLLDMQLAFDTISISETMDSNSRFLKFTVPFEKNKSDYLVEDIKPFLDSIQLNRFNIKEIEIRAYSSIEGNPVANELLQQKRAASILTAIKEYQLQEVQTKIESFENWEGFFESIKGSPYEADFKNKSRDEIRNAINSDTLNYNLEPYLAGQRKAEIKIFVESIYIDSLQPEHLKEKFRKSIADKDYIRAKALQTLMFRAVKNKELPVETLFEVDIPQYKEFIPLASNQLAFRLEFNRGHISDSLVDKLRMEAEALWGVDPSNGHVNFNKQAIKLYYWAKDLNILIVDEENKIDQVRDFYQDIKKLYNTKINNIYVNRLLLNYNIIAADFYYEHKDYKNRSRSLKQVFSYVKKAKLNREQTYIMARYFIFQIEVDWAVQIMLPFIKSGDYDEEFLFTFLSIAVYHENRFSEERLHSLFQTAAEKYPKELCGMFGKPGMSPDFFSDLTLKSIYCKTCP